MLTQLKSTELWQILQYAWNNPPAKHHKKLTTSVPLRIGAVLKANTIRGIIFESISA